MSKAPYHRIKDIIASGQYISPNQLWHDYSWPKIYTKKVIEQLAIGIINEDSNG